MRWISVLRIPRCAAPLPLQPFASGDAHYTFSKRNALQPGQPPKLSKSLRPVSNSSGTVWTSCPRSRNASASIAGIFSSSLIFIQGVAAQVVANPLLRKPRQRRPQHAPVAQSALENHQLFFRKNKLAIAGLFFIYFWSFQTSNSNFKTN